MRKKMKVLIEIDEEVYKHIREHNGLAYAVEDYLYEVEQALTNGTPLSKDTAISALKQIEEITRVMDTVLMKCDDSGARPIKNTSRQEAYYALYRIQKILWEGKK